MLLTSMIVVIMMVNRSAAKLAGAAKLAISPWHSRRKRRSDRGLKREAVIQAAAKAFNLRGFHNTSLDDIAATLAVTKPTIYYYVDNKEQLLFECFCAGLEPIQTAIRDARQGNRPARERLRRVLLRYAKAIASEFGWCMVRAEDQDLSAQMRAHVKALKSEIDQGMRHLIQEGLNDGSIGHCDPKMTAFALAGALNWIAHWYQDSHGQSAAQVAADFVKLFENGLRPRLS